MEMSKDSIWIQRRHTIILGKRHLRYVLLWYMKYYYEIRTQLSLEKDAPVPRAIGTVGHILYRPVLGGLHHQYVRILLTTGTPSGGDLAVGDGPR